MNKFDSIPGKYLWLGPVLASFFLVGNTAIAGNGNDGQRTKTVNCYGGGKSVQETLDKVEAGRDTTIYIVGFCDEHVNVVKDGITLSGNKDGNGVIGGGLAEVTVTGAQRVVVEYLNLTGSGSGIGVGENSSILIRHNHIYDNEADGVGVYFGSFAKLESNTIERNGQQEDEEAGIQVYQGAIVRSEGNNVSDNGYAAVEVGSVSYFRSYGGDVLVQAGCSEDALPGEGFYCGDPGTVALDCYRSGTCEFRDTYVTGSIDISSLSNFDARNSTANGNLFGSGGSRIRMRGSVTGTYSVYCFDPVVNEGTVPCGGSYP